MANLRLAQVLHLIGGKSLLSRKTFDAQETSVWSFSEKYSRFFHLRPMHLPELALLSSNVIWRLVGTNSSQAKELRRISKQKFMSCFQTEIRPHDSENKRRASQETGAESSKKKVKVIDIRHSSSEVHQENKSFGKLE